MSIMRSVLLWGSRSQGLREFLPRYKFVRRAVTRFMPGETILDALSAAESLKPYGIAAVVTHLGENLTEEREANNVAKHYLMVLQEIKKRKLDCHISLKLTQLGLDLNEALARKHLLRIVRKAKELRNFVWIDMESSAYVDRTLDMFKRVRAKYSNVGVCVQSYLFRTATDLQALSPLAPSVRLVKGTYAEPRHVAYASKKDVDENYFNLAMALIKAAKSNKANVGIGTHDLDLIRRIDTAATRQKMKRDLFEIQMLYGIKRDKQLQMAQGGFNVRTLISYGTFWFPWYMRRLAERPANVLFVLRNMFVR